jgi:hypothetical protein
MFASLITLLHFAISLYTIAAKASGVVGAATAPKSAKRFFI